jgi:hypothetical protein
MAEARGGANDANDIGNRRRPENAPSEPPDDCPICFEPLFNAEGIALEGKEVAKIMCIHLVHSDCLAAAGRALNADGKRYGVGGFGAPRAGCPVCASPVSFWVSYTSKAAFSSFWMHRMQACLEEFGPSNGPIRVKLIKRMLRDDSSLTREQKKWLKKEDTGFLKALADGNAVWVNEVLNGGPENGGSMRMYFAPGIWDWDKQENTLWLTKWGPVRLPAPVPVRSVSVWNRPTGIAISVALAFIAVLIGLWLQWSQTA